MALSSIPSLENRPQRCVSTRKGKLVLANGGILFLQISNQLGVGSDALLRERNLSQRKASSKDAAGNHHKGNLLGDGHPDRLPGGLVGMQGDNRTCLLDQRRVLVAHRHGFPIGMSKGQVGTIGGNSKP